jgi:hypothetical protein
MTKLHLELVRPEVKKLIKPYLEKLIDIHRSNIISINLYGSATGGDFFLKTSDINLLIIFKKLTFGDLKKSLKIISRGIKKKIAAPLVLTQNHIKTSQDVFPIEFLDMKENHLCLYGENVLDSININAEHLRLFCEEQIKGKLIRLRQAYLEIGLRRKGIEALMKESLYALIPVFRNLLRLKSIVPTIDKEDILRKLSAKFDLNAEVFVAILRDKQNDEKIAGVNVEVYFEKYFGQIEKLAQAVDKL